MKPRGKLSGPTSTGASLTSEDYVRFLNALDRADFEVTDWEAGFIESNLTRVYFTEQQRITLDRLIERYGERLGY